MKSLEEKKLNILRLVFIIVFLTVVIIDKGHASEPYLGDLGEIVFYGKDIIVYGKKTPMNAVITVSEIASKDIEERGAQTVADALEFVPGVDVQVGGKGESSLNIRGFEQRDFKVLIDGVPAYEGYFGTVDLFAIPAESIEKIVVIKGASSVLYGVNTMGGVVNIITKKGTEKKTNFSISFGDYNTQNYICNHGAQYGEIKYYLGYSWRSSDGLRLSSDFDSLDKWVGENTEYREDGGKRELSDYKKQLFIANISYEPDANTRANLSLNYFKNERGCPVEKNRYWRFSNWSQWQVSLASEKRLSSIVALKTRFFYVDHGDEIVDDANRTIAAGGRAWFDRSRYDDFSIGGEIHSHLSLGKLNLMRIGVNYQKDQNKQKEYNAKNRDGEVVIPGWGDEETYEASTYCIGVEDLLRCTDKFFLSFGVSYDRFVPLKSADMSSPGNISVLNPQAGATYDIAGNTTLCASIGKKTRFPRMMELYSKHTGGNPDLKAEQTIAVDIGIKHKIKIFMNMYASYFYNNVSNLIESTRDNDGNQMYINVGRAQIYGVETELMAAISSSLNIKGNYTYLHAWDKENNREIPQRPEHKLNLNVHYRFSFGVSFVVVGSYVGKQKHYYIEAGETKERSISGYFLADLKISHRFPLIKSGMPELYIMVNNIMDENYEEGNGPMPGRNFLVGLNIVL